MLRRQVPGLEATRSRAGGGGLIAEAEGIGGFINRVLKGLAKPESQRQVTRARRVKNEKKPLLGAKNSRDEQFSCLLLSRSAAGKASAGHLQPVGQQRA